MTQPIRLVLPDLFQDRLAKLTEHAAHVDMVTGAVAVECSRVLVQRALSVALHQAGSQFHGGVTPVPDGHTLSGVLVAVVEMLSLADLVAAANGLNSMPIVQEASGIRLDGQSFV